MVHVYTCNVLLKLQQTNIEATVNSHLMLAIENFFKLSGDCFILIYKIR